jgi:hypothetical protein
MSKLEILSEATQELLGEISDAQIVYGDGNGSLAEPAASKLIRMLGQGPWISHRFHIVIAGKVGLAHCRILSPDGDVRFSYEKEFLPIERKPNTRG